MDDARGASARRKFPTIQQHHATRRGTYKSSHAAGPILHSVQILSNLFFSWPAIASLIIVPLRMAIDAVVDPMTKCRMVALVMITMVRCGYGRLALFDPCIDPTSFFFFWSDCSDGRCEMRNSNAFNKWCTEKLEVGSKCDENSGKKSFHKIPLLLFPFLISCYALMNRLRYQQVPQTDM